MPAKVEALLRRYRSTPMRELLTAGGYLPAAAAASVTAP